MFMATDMIEEKPGVLEGLKLCPDFPFQLLLYPGTEVEIDPHLEKMGGKLTS